jgi:Mg/Co/Ni transporter MgtE
MSSTLRLLPLHENQHFQNHVIELLNDEWPQSKTIRMRRLERSCNEFPLSYILIDNHNQLLGYCYLDRLLDDEQSVIIESVCIQRKLRGNG